MTAYVNPAWRWYHGDNHELECNPFTWTDETPHWSVVFCCQCRMHVKPEWHGYPKPPPIAWDAALRLNERFTHLRGHAWLAALGPRPHGTLAAMQADMPEWPHLFAFHAFTAAWLSLPTADDQAVFLDAWESANLRGTCAGRICGGRD